MIGEKTEKTEEFWRRACSTKDGEFQSKFPVIDDADYHCLTFGSPKYQDYSDHITELAIKGIKRATTHLKIDFEINDVPRRCTGDYWMILWENLTPAVIVKLVNVEECAFRDVSAAFAAREGEGDGSLEFWKNCHEEYFKLQLADWNRDWSEDLVVVLESFEVVMANPEDG
jgi:uncharacterized protein YhfF